MRPPILKKKDDAQDFHRLQNDMSKYYAGSTLFTDELKEEWKHLVDPKSHHYSDTDQEEAVWLLPYLNQLKLADEENHDDDPLLTIEATEIASRVQKQDHGPFPKVEKNYKFYGNLIIFEVIFYKHTD